MAKKQGNLTDEVTAVLEEIVEDKEKKEVKGEVVVSVSDTEFLIGNRQYKLLTNYREGFDPQRLGERYSEVLARYDYIVGDWGYEQLRLKGFFESSNRKAMPDQRIDMLEDYLYEYCNFGCAYFVIQRIGGKRDKTNNRRRKKRQNPSQAHVSEKKENLSERNKKKPVIKNKQPKEKAPKKTIVKETKKGFTIRKRED
ncbi:YutD family protein [Enterococcus olivae]